MQYRTKGVCASLIDFDIEERDGVSIVTNIKFTNGCNGNTQGVSKLAEGMPVDEVIKRLSGIKCGHRSTSCPDQLAEALKAAR